MKKVKKEFVVVGFLFLIVILHLVVLSKMIFFPYPELFIYPYLTAQGLLPYKQILDQHFPGLMFFPINLFTLGMRTPEIARIWQYGIIMLTHALIYTVAKKLFKSEQWALLTNFFFLLWQPFFEGYVLWIDSFIPLFILPSFYFMFEWNNKKQAKKLFLSGLFLGITLLFKQVVLPLVFLVGLFVWCDSKKFKKTLPLFFGFALPTALMLVYIYSIGVWRDFIFWTVTFNLTTFAQMGRKFPDMAGLIKSAPVFLLAGVAWVMVFLKTKKSKSKLESIYWLLGMFFIGSLTFAYARFDFVHFQPALPFAILILILVIKKLSIKRASVTILTYTLASIVFLFPFYKHHVGKRVSFFGEFENRLVNKVRQRVGEGDTIFALGTTPHIYQLTNTLPPGNIFVFQFPWFMIEAEERVLTGIINDLPKVVVRDMSATTGGVNLVSYMQNINQYIKENYKVVDRVNNTEIMIKR